MDFLKEALKSQAGHKPSHSNNNNSGEEHNHQTKPHKQPSTSELLSSAKIVAEAAKAQMAHSKEEVDKKKVAGAAGDLLCGIKHYGKLEETSGIGKYVGKAETYLHKYESSHSTGGPPTVAEESNSKKKDGHGHGHGHGGAGDYFKMAEGFLKK